MASLYYNLTSQPHAIHLSYKYISTSLCPFRKKIYGYHITGWKTVSTEAKPRLPPSSQHGKTRYFSPSYPHNKRLGIRTTNGLSRKWYMMFFYLRLRHIFERFQRFLSGSFRLWTSQDMHSFHYLISLQNVLVGDAFVCLNGYRFTNAILPLLSFKITKAKQTCWIPSF